MCKNLAILSWCLLALVLSNSSSATVVITPDPLRPQDQADFERLVAECEELSPAVHELMEIVRRSSRTVTVDPVRSDGTAGDPNRDVAWDSFADNRVDLSDMDKASNPSRDANGNWVFPLGISPLATSRCQILAHFIWERFHAQFTGPGNFAPAHASGNDYEDRVRRDFGQDGHPVNTNGNSAGNVTTVFINDDFYVETTPMGGPLGGDPSGPSTVTKVKLVCMFRCEGGTSFPIGADTEAAARGEATARCGGAANLNTAYICRSK
ncbi:MAG: hypothetical protein R3241_04225 [Rheinheimera sp.]|nr:hypothetical protein [Rheinheimera sp.]